MGYAEIGTAAELRELLGEPHGRAVTKERARPHEMAVRGKRPIMALLVEIETIFFHCAKAFLRSSIWQPETWRPDVLPSHACLVKSLQDTPETMEELEAYYAPANYTRLLY